MVCMLIISALIPFAANCSAASIAFQTKCPVAIIVTSVPSFSKIALPISKFWSGAVKFGTDGLPNLK